MRIWAHLFGVPDGHLVRLRCWALGHDWWTCTDTCCEAELDWCERCHVSQASRWNDHLRPEGDA